MVACGRGSEPQRRRGSLESEAGSVLIEFAMEILLHGFVYLKWKGSD